MPNTVGFLGAGQLGEPMVDRLLGAGRDVVAYARRPEVRRRLEVKGAAVADSVADLARSSDVLVSCLFSDAQLRETGLGAGGFIANMKPGAIFVSHTTGTLSTLGRCGTVLRCRRSSWTPRSVAPPTTSPRAR